MLNEYLAKVNAMKADLDKIAELVKVTDLDIMRVYENL